MRGALPVERLGKICGLLGSDYDGERAAAAAAASRLLREAGWSWADLVEASRACPVVQPPPQPRQPVGHQARAVQALRQAAALSEWECGFLRSLALQRRPLSPKQAATLARIEERLG